MVGHFDNKHRCLEEKNVPKALILPSRWQDSAESLGMEHTYYLRLYQVMSFSYFIQITYSHRRQL